MKKDYKEAIKLCREGLKKRLDSQSKYQVCLSLLQALKVEYDETDNVDKQREYCNIAIEEIKPQIEIEFKMRKELTDDEFFEFYSLYEQVILFAAKKSFKHFLIAMELGKMKKVWEVRLDLFEPLIYWLEQMYFDRDGIELIRASFPPRIW